MKKNKFRAYDKTRKEYLSAGNIFISIEPRQLPQDSNIYLDMIKYPNMYKDRFVIEQYININDKNKNEIYEGDILEVYYSTPDGKSHITKVVVEGIDNFGLMLDLENSDSLEIIGNIHDKIK